MPLNSHVTTVVRHRAAEGARIARFELTCPDYWELPAFSAGAHIDVVLPGGQTRQYSLCGDPADRYRYQIAVLRDEQGRGGSLAMHALVETGATLAVSVPRNLFGLSPCASRHLFIAGGVGITPFIAMIGELERRGGRYELHYCVRSMDDAAFLATLQPRAARGLVRFYTQGMQRLDLAALLGQPQAGEHVYCCGPARMLDDFLQATRGWPEGSVHYERFGKDESVSSPPYEVRLARSQRTIRVEANQTLAAALMADGAPVKVACEAGVCGTCTVRYLAGHPVHRDLILSAQERAQCMTPCVSSGDGGDLELDL